MRRSEREITDKGEILALLAMARVLHLALCDGEAPYVVPLNFGHSEGKLYFHCATEGRKLDLIRTNPRVAFSIVCDQRIVTAPEPCGWTAKYLSLAGTGRAAILTGPAEKERGLAAIMAHHGGPATGFNPKHLERTAVVEIAVDSMTGKANR